MKAVDDIVDRVCAEWASPKQDSALDTVYKTIDDWRCGGAVDAVAELLSKLAERTDSIEVLLSCLIGTNTGRGDWTDELRRARSACGIRIKTLAPDRHFRILQGLGNDSDPDGDIAKILGVRP